MNRFHDSNDDRNIHTEAPLPPAVRIGAGTRESAVEAVLVRETRRCGGWALKLVCPGAAGIPDRLVLGPGGRVAFVELKAPGRLPTLLQSYRIEQLRALGFRAEIVDSAGSARRIAREVSGR